MEYNELTGIIGENCKEYIAKDDILMISMRLSSVSCDNCSHYVGGFCNKDSFEKLKQMAQNN
ncbi:hypothetical protein [Clostridium folliculivorans]|uniref:Uncharacterized protein n=1 Tax=Clostridium folliculivorans TaxID=2886038 RepID=A0A9W5Y677_9CLOT|nr:hypothetical protein [Clostridium folliculivorans]GKU27388.1 hypothetical protein CFOLD11_42150 [Clostridium folliculivorans]GKU32239.1 hypothetical protein CFB3_43470 [Clostridium folliculivorans]